MDSSREYLGQNLKGKEAADRAVVYTKSNKVVQSPGGRGAQSIHTNKQ